MACPLLLTQTRAIHNCLLLTYLSFHHLGPSWAQAKVAKVAHGAVPGLRYEVSPPFLRQQRHQFQHPDLHADQVLAKDTPVLQLPGRILTGVMGRGSPSTEHPRERRIPRNQWHIDKPMWNDVLCMSQQDKVLEKPLASRTRSDKLRGREILFLSLFSDLSL